MTFRRFEAKMKDAAVEILSESSRREMGDSQRFGELMTALSIALNLLSFKSNRSNPI